MRSDWDRSCDWEDTQSQVIDNLDDIRQLLSNAEVLIVKGEVKRAILEMLRVIDYTQGQTALLLRDGMTE